MSDNLVKVGDRVCIADDQWRHKQFLVVSETAKRFGLQMILDNGEVWNLTRHVAKHNVFPTAN